MEELVDVSPVRPGRPGVLRHPLAWGVVVTAAGVAVALISGDLGVGTFILLLIGGWLMGLGITVIARHQPTRRRQRIVLLTATVLGGASAWVLIFGTQQAGGALPEAVVGITATAGIALAVAAGWCALGFIGALGSGGAAAPALMPRDWERPDRHPRVLFRAAPLTQGAVLWLIVGAIVIGGLVAIGVSLTADGTVLMHRPRLLMAVVGVLVVAPLLIALSIVIRSRQVDCTALFRDDALVLSIGDSEVSTRYEEITRLTWATTGDFARVDVRTRTDRASLLLTFAKNPRGTTGGLPELPPHVLNRLNLAGLDRRPQSARGRRSGVSVFERV